jgi:deazaflavin-dependent oxidoreductase (nitroreductase family)
LLVGGTFLLLTTKGRNTGKMRTTPLEYRKRNGVIHIFSARGKKADWFKNLTANPDDAIVRIKFRKFCPQFTIIEQWEEKEEIIKWYINEYPMAAKLLFGWDSKTDDPEETDVSSLLEFLQIIQLREQRVRNLNP